MDKLQTILQYVLLASLSSCGLASNTDLFSYGLNNRFGVYGQLNWDEVTCSNIDTCTGYPNKYPHGFGFSIEGENNCKWCPEDGNQKRCGLHRQSPIDLKRDRGIEGHENEKECPDWHWMQYKNDTCTWEDMKNQFSIERHALQIHVPQRADGSIDCQHKDGRRRYPRIDYSKGFPDWWWMQRIDIAVPSQHTQEGHRYAGEITLAHFYEVEHEKNQLGHVSVFIQDYPDVEPWSYLDKLICAWRKVEWATRKSCSEKLGYDIELAPPYGLCVEDESLAYSPRRTSSPSKSPTRKPTSSPTRKPTSSPTRKPTNPTAVRDSANGPPASPATKPDSNPTRRPIQSPMNEFPDLSLETETVICENHDDIERMCNSDDPCCGSTRSASSFCWNIYENVFPGDTIYAACSQCCNLDVGDPAPALPSMPKTIQCANVDNPHRLCKPDSCCSNPRSFSRYCLGIYQQYGNDMDQVCHYCCHSQENLELGAITGNNPTLLPVPLPASRQTQRPIASPTASPTTPSPTQDPSNEPSPSPTRKPTIPPTSSPTQVIPCDEYDVVERMCRSSEPCCGSTRSATSFCWNIYENVFPGDLTYAACSQCCSLAVGDPAPILSSMPKTIQCSSIDNPYRLCKPNSCCSNPRSSSRFCAAVYDQYGDDMEQVCHYCCSEPQELGPKLRRALRAYSNVTSGQNNDVHTLNTETKETHVSKVLVSESNKTDPNDQLEESSPRGSKRIQVGGKSFLLQPEDFEDEEHDSEENLQRTYNEYVQRRRLGDHHHKINYEDIMWEAYAFMIEVGTEYYFRYEGTMMVPPCWEVVHHRVMKDPIKVHPRQIEELNRLIMERRDPGTCAKDTAGVVYSTEPRKIDVSREIQYYHTQHRKVFCECKDWPSKFPNDKAWCSNWQTDDKRFYDTPYSFDSNGEWLPN